MNHDEDLLPTWLWKLKVETTKPGKETLVTKVGQNGQLMKIPEQEIIKMKSFLCFDIRKIIEYHETDEKNITAVLIDQVGHLRVLWDFEDFDKEFRRRFVLLEEQFEVISD